MITFKAYLTELRKIPHLTDFIKKHVTQDILRDDRDSLLKRRELRKGQEILDLAAKSNFKKLGRGAYAIVFGNEKYPYAVKIYDLNDKGFAAWIKFVLAHQSNPYVPKIKGRPTTIPGSGHGFVRMEKLREITDSEALAFKKKAYIDKDPHIAQILDFINKSGRHYDMTDNNLLVRPDGHVVVVDPLS